MIKNLKQFLIIALLILHSPHMSHADLGQAAVIGAWASGGAILCTLGAYNFWSTKHIITIEEEKEIVYKDGGFGKTSSDYTVKKTIKKVPSPYSPSWVEVLKNTAMCATGFGIVFHAWHVAMDNMD